MMPVPRRSAVRLQKRLLAVLIAGGAYGMERFGLVANYFVHIGKCTPLKFFEFILFLLAFPFYRLSYLCFKLSYLLQQRELRRLGGQCAALGGHDLSGQFECLRLEGGRVSEIHHRLSNVASNLKR